VLTSLKTACPRRVPHDTVPSLPHQPALKHQPPKRLLQHRRRHALGPAEPPPFDASYGVRRAGIHCQMRANLLADICDETIGVSHVRSDRLTPPTHCKSDTTREFRRLLGWNRQMMLEWGCYDPGLKRRRGRASRLGRAISGSEKPQLVGCAEPRMPRTLQSRLAADHNQRAQSGHLHDDRSHHHGRVRHHN
jgi:hypothetical protein